MKWNYVARKQGQSKHGGNFQKINIPENIILLFKFKIDTGSNDYHKEINQEVKKQTNLRIFK